MMPRTPTAAVDANACPRPRTATRAAPGVVSDFLASASDRRGSIARDRAEFMLFPDEKAFTHEVL